MIKKFIVFLIAIVLLISTVSCDKPYQKFSTEYFDLFDTVIKIVVYEKEMSDAGLLFDKVHKEFERLHKIFDAYNNYDGLVNLKTVNDSAGKGPVKVPEELFDLIKKTMDYYGKYSKKVDISLGEVYKIWSDCRAEFEQGAQIDSHGHSHGGEKPVLPKMADLEFYKSRSGMDKIKINEAEKTIEIIDNDVIIDLGAVAKGYATELVADFAKKNGMKSGIINAGGNVRTVGVPLNGNDMWNVGIENPFSIDDEKESNVLAVCKVKETAVVSSGDYQRFYVVDGKRYHHIIDPDTLMPGNKFRSVTIVGPDSGLSDFLSTSVFLMNYEDGRKLIESLDSYDALWVFQDHSVKMTDNMKSFTKIGE